MNPPRYSVLVVGFRSQEFIVDCIGSLLSDPRPDLEVLFLDNASPQPEAELVRATFGADHRLRVLESPGNLFFAGGMDFLAEQALGDILVLVNPDSRCGPGFFDALDAHDAQSPLQVAMGELRRLNKPDEIQSAGILVNRLGLVLQLPRGGPLRRRPIFGANGACFLVRASLFSSLGGFDRSFEMYFEETDFCWRAWLAGHRVEFLPGVVLFHAEGGSSQGGNDRRQYRFCRNRMASLARNLDALDLPWVLPLHVGAVLLFALTSALRGRSGQALGTFRGILAGLVRVPGILATRRPTLDRPNRHLRKLGVQPGPLTLRVPFSHA